MARVLYCESMGFSHMIWGSTVYIGGGYLSFMSIAQVVLDELLEFNTLGNIQIPNPDC